MPITDLTGYTWVANSEPTFTTFNYSLNFSSNNDNYSSISCTIDHGYKLEYGNDTAYWAGSWLNDSYKTIVITGGTDATNATLIAWLEANGTLTAPAPAATPSLNFGGSDVSLFLGSSYVSKVYLGSTLLYEGEAPTPSNAILTADNTYLVDSTGGYLLTTEI